MYDINEKEIKNIDRKANKAIDYITAEYQTKLNGFNLAKEASKKFQEYEVHLYEVGFMPFYAECVFSAVEDYAMKTNKDIQISYDSQAIGNLLFVNGIEIDQLSLNFKDQLSLEI